MRGCKRLCIKLHSTEQHLCAIFKLLSISMVNSGFFYFISTVFLAVFWVWDVTDKECVTYLLTIYFTYSQACSVLRNWTALVNQCGLNPPKKHHCMFTISAFTFYILSSLLWSKTWQCVQTRVSSERNKNYIPQKKFAEVFLIGKTHLFKQYFCEILSEPIVTSYFWWI